MKTDYEINCEVANKLGYTSAGSKTGSSSVFVHDKKGIRPYDWVNRPDHYITLVIEYEIEINFSDAHMVWCNWDGESSSRSFGEDFNKTEIGQAVCQAFLLMKIESA
tara:strand:+ start:58194 stop:58514 length:321 start_codon:yes stop_codon:yes gene_type:complete